ncbi:MAG: hypothetical protein ACE147_09800 [Candidatus Methylomirabilales bacterium]
MAQDAQWNGWVVVGQSQNGDILFVVGPFDTSDRGDAWAKGHLTGPVRGSGLRYYITEMQAPGDL